MKHIVTDLVSEQKTAALSSERACREFQRIALTLEDVKIEMQTAKQEQNKTQVSRVQKSNPPKLKGCHCAKIRRQKRPGKNCDGKPEGVVRPEVAGKSKKPFGRSEGLYWPYVYWG